MTGCKILVVSGIRAVAVGSRVVLCQSRGVAFSDSTVVQVFGFNLEICKD
jgi:hypothetical protein